MQQLFFSKQSLKAIFLEEGQCAVFCLFQALVGIIFLAYGYVVRHITEQYNRITFKKKKKNGKSVFKGSGSNFFMVISIFFSSKTHILFDYNYSAHTDYLLSLSSILSMRYQGLFFQEQSRWSITPTTHLNQMPRYEYVGLYLHSSIYLYNLVLQEILPLSK